MKKPRGEAEFMMQRDARICLTLITMMVTVRSQLTLDSMEMYPIL